MKLTKKGLLKVIGGLVVDSPEYPLSKTLDNWNREKDFDQDDFQNVVILSVEEAKALLRRIPEFKENSDWQLPIETLKQRIKQAETK